MAPSCQFDAELVVCVAIGTPTQHGLPQRHRIAVLGISLDRLQRQAASCKQNDQRPGRPTNGPIANRSPTEMLGNSGYREPKADDEKNRDRSKRQIHSALGANFGSYG